MGCVANSQNLRKVHDEFGEDPRFHMVSFSVNSKGDTADKVAAFMDKQGIDKPNWWYLTAEDDRLDQYTVDFFHLNAPKPVADEELAAKVGIIAHDLRVVLVDGKANIRGYYDLLNTTEVEEFEKTVGELNLDRLKRDLRFILDNEMKEAGAVSLEDLPALNASLNATATVLIIAGLISIKAGRTKVHIGFMIAALIASTAFLTSYLIYHAQTEPTRFAHEGWIRPVYFFILLTHIPAAAVNLPMIITTVVPAIRQRFAFHKRVARWTYPIWLYVSVTGVLVYLILYVWFPSP